jgi:hypothetical protein
MVLRLLTYHGESELAIHAPQNAMDRLVGRLFDRARRPPLLHHLQLDSFVPGE